MRKAVLSHKGTLTSFSFKGVTVRFASSPYLEKWTDIVKWDKGYIEATAKFKHGEEEDYIDLIPILDNLMIDKDRFLSDIDEVAIDYDDESGPSADDTETTPAPAEMPVKLNCRDYIKDNAALIVGGYAFIKRKFDYGRPYWQIFSLNNLSCLIIINGGDIHETDMTEAESEAALRCFKLNSELLKTADR